MVATSHDVMPDIELYQPTDEANALALANTLGSDGWLLAGGQDTFGWLKDRNKAAGAMIELTRSMPGKAFGRPLMALRLARSRLSLRSPRIRSSGNATACWRRLLG